MTALPRKGWTVETYLAFERESETRHEYDHGEIIMMAGGSPEHSQLASRVGHIFERDLDIRSCRIFQSDIQIKVSKRIYRYPDVSALCGTPIYEDGMLLNPSVIVEVLSPSTEKYDRTKKFDQYRAIAALQEIVFISSDEYRIECFSRGSDRRWGIEIATESGESVALPSVNAMLAIDDVYARVSFDAPPTDDAPAIGNS